MSLKPVARGPLTGNDVAGAGGEINTASGGATIGGCEDNTARGFVATVRGARQTSPAATPRSSSTARSRRTWGKRETSR